MLNELNYFTPEQMELITKWRYERLFYNSLPDEDRAMIKWHATKPHNIYGDTSQKRLNQIREKWLIYLDNSK